MVFFSNLYYTLILLHQIEGSIAFMAIFLVFEKKLTVLLPCPEIFFLLFCSKKDLKLSPL